MPGDTPSLPTSFRPRPIFVVLLVAVVAGALALGFALEGAPSAHRGGSAGTTTTISRRPAALGGPSTFVDDDGNGGIAVYSVSTGRMVRQLATQGSGGPDEAPSVGAGGTVFFDQPSSCGEAAAMVPETGGSAVPLVLAGPGVVGGNALLFPTPGPTPGVIAALEVFDQAAGGTCHQVPQAVVALRLDGSTATVLDAIALDGASLGGGQGSPLSWAPSGHLIAMSQVAAKASAPHIVVEGFDLPLRERARARVVIVPAPTCTLAEPAFGSSSLDLTAVERCSAVPERIVEVAVATSAVVKVLVALSTETQAVQSIDYDRSGQHLLYTEGEGPTCGTYLPACPQIEATVIRRVDPTGSSVVARALPNAAVW